MYHNYVRTWYYIQSYNTLPAPIVKWTIRPCCHELWSHPWKEQSECIAAYTRELGGRRLTAEHITELKRERRR